jgi:hypothetical protein
MGVFDSETNMAGMQPDVACWHRWKKCNDDSIQDMMLWSWSII